MSLILAVADGTLQYPLMIFRLSTALWWDSTIFLTNETMSYKLINRWLALSDVAIMTTLHGTMEGWPTYRTPECSRHSRCSSSGNEVPPFLISSYWIADLNRISIFGTCQVSERVRQIIPFIIAAPSFKKNLLPHRIVLNMWQCCSSSRNVIHTNYKYAAHFSMQWFDVQKMKRWNRIPSVSTVVCHKWTRL